MSPHKWGVFDRVFDRRRGKMVDRLLSRHKSELAAKARLNPRLGGSTWYFIRRLTAAERARG